LRLRADCVGDRLSLSVNNQLVIEARDGDFPEGDVGLLIGAFDDAGTDLYFDDFAVSQPGAAGATLYQEDFSDPASGWARYEDADYLTDYVDGGYRINVTLDSYDVWSHPGYTFDDVQMEVDVTRIGGPEQGEFGLVCRYQDNGDFYALKITGDGYFGIAKRNGGEWIVLADWQTSDAIRLGAETNHLRADCVDSRLALYVNGQLLAEAQDGEYVSGDIGLLAGTFEQAGTDVLFDNLLVFQPSGADASVTPTPTGGDVLFADDFSDPNSGWADSQEADYEIGYSDGVYRVYLAVPDLAVWSPALQTFDDVVIDVDAAKTAGSDNNNVGVMCRYLDTDNFYLLQISTDGYYNIAKRQAGEWTLLGTGEFEFSSAILQGNAVNHLRAECVGDTLRLTVNDVILTEVQDADFAGGDVGLLAGSIDEGGIEVLFDDFTVRRP